MSNYLFNGVECEDYDKHWGFTQMRGKIILDVGADSGSTASYFLDRGAKRVIAVSGRAEYDGLVANVKKFGWENLVIPVNCWISGVQDFVNLINNYRPDILKCDLDPETREIKLPEWYLFECPDEILRKVPEYMIEWHDNESPECVNPNHMLYVWPERFEKLGYNVETQFHSGIVIHAWIR